MKSGSSALIGSGGQSAETSAASSSSQWSRPVSQATSPPVWRTTRHLTSCGQCSSALLTLVLSAVTLPPRGASSAVITVRASQSLMRLASASGEKPAKTMEWMAPMRAQASMAKAASGIIGR